jgi:hypothetical protein
LNQSKREQEQQRIASENQAILDRISARQPYYDRAQWERDFDRSAQLKSQIARYPPNSGESTSPTKRADSRKGAAAAAAAAAEADEPAAAAAAVDDAAEEGEPSA